MKRTPIIVTGIIAIVVLASIAIVPMVISLIRGGAGIKTEGINESSLQAASTDIDGTWSVSGASGPNQTSAGFTFFEVLPAERKSTSGSTREVSGSVTVESGTLSAGEIVVDMDTLTTDSDVRDNNVRRKILHTDQYPVATFVVTEPVDVTHVPDDGTVAPVELTGDLTIHGVTNTVTQEFAVARTGDNVVVAGDIPIARTDYGVETPEFVAAKIADEGEINIRVNLEKSE
ncbi:YceI family protein [Corynebacterium timonense]|uniref:Polyisoprenoid-binding protein YceI n=1 Tax=Corynebacterium timonense TaxID=441500 RepID=A0A1H1PA27_9CORY|nr:YceI family protein [Corynebacterium timonense]SDS07920.1 Polyisoprenoid-binding protein YceI [Corynebacterium timonense]